MDYQTTPEGRDPQLWRMAQKRASFKRHFATYIVINIFLWILWAFTGSKIDGSGLPWPAWTTFGWGIGIAFHFIGTYVKTDSVEKEYDRLKNQHK